MLGEGDGRALEQLLSFAPDAQIHVVESSGKMIALARARCAGQLHRIRFDQRDALDFSREGEQYDAITTLYFLDCFQESEARELVSQVARALVPGGLWLMTDFAVSPTAVGVRWHSKTHHRHHVPFLRRKRTGLHVRALPPIKEILRSSGLKMLESRSWRWGLIRSELWINSSA